MLAKMPELYAQETLIVRLAREIAIDLNDVETILKNYDIDDETWSKLSTSPQFLERLRSELAEWNDAKNTHERAKLKAGALIEEWLLEANKLLHSSEESLDGKVKLGQLLTKIAGMGNEAVVTGGGGERFQVTINLGADHKLKFDKALPVIEGEIIPQE